MTTTIKAALAVGSALLLLVTGCSGSGGNGEGGSSAVEAQRGASAGEVTRQGSSANVGEANQAEPARARPDLSREVIQTAHLTVRTGRVDSARARVRAIAQAAGGIVAAEQTSAGRHGGRESVLTLRVRADRFADVLERLAGLGRVQERQTSSEDVTLQVVDVEARIASAQRALVRLREILDQAQSLSDVVTLENELLRREADLEALKSQQAYLADQAALSTITLTLRQPSEDEPVEEDLAGFVGGLDAGWSALMSVLGFAATVLGALLPFALLLGVLLAPTWLLLRRTRVWKRSAG